MFQPIYVGYERLVEGNSYTAELSGQKKKSESLGDLFKVFGILKQRYGKVHVSFAEPVFLNDLLDLHTPGWLDKSLTDDERPAWLNPLVDTLGQQIMTGINQATHVNAINLLAAILLTTRKLAMDRSELRDQLELYKDLLQQCSYSGRITITEKSAEEIIAYGVELGAIENREHPLGDIVAVAPGRSALLTYFRNNISHLLAVPSLVASCFLNSRRMEKEQLHRIALRLYPFLKSELFLPWDEEEFADAVDQQISWLVDKGLLNKLRRKQRLQRPDGGTQQDLQLRIIGHALLQTFERYYITVAILAKNGSGSMSRSELERLCSLTAQRISQLNEFAAPEFSDRYLFRHFIALLRDNDILTTNEDEKIEYNSVIQQISNDAKFILSREIRHGIIRVAPQVLEE
jgi:glycerol-3-phosphate O-acyltransferase